MRAQAGARGKSARGERLRDGRVRLRRGARGESVGGERLRGGRVRAQVGEGTTALQRECLRAGRVRVEAGCRGREHARGSASWLGVSRWGRGVRGDSARG